MHQASKEVLSFRPLSLRGLPAAIGEWGLGCLAFNLKRLHILLGAEGEAFALGVRNASYDAQSSLINQSMAN